MSAIPAEHDDLMYEVPGSRLRELRAAESRLAHLEEGLRRGAEIASQYLDTERGDLDGWVDYARSLLADQGGAE